MMAEKDILLVKYKQNKEDFDQKNKILVKLKFTELEH